MKHSGKKVGKTKRQKNILELITKEEVITQQMLKKRLEEKGILVTQATLSRDIRELNLMKRENGKGYEQSGFVPRYRISHKLHVLFSIGVKTVECSGNILVITCESGMASSICSMIDGLKWGEIVGTIAGNNAIFVITREGTASELVERFQNIG